MQNRPIKHRPGRSPAGARARRRHRTCRGARRWG